MTESNATAEPQARPHGMIARLIYACGSRPGLVVGLTAALAVLGGVSAFSTPLDALPDLTDTQVIIATEWMGRGPTLIEDQITYPLVTSMLSLPRVRTVRGFSMFSMSFVYVIYEDGTDLYWARTRVLEQLSKLQGRFPEGVTPALGPDATGLGWVYEYALVSKDGRHDAAELRTLQDFYLRYALSSVEGVAEIASVGGFQREYRIVVDPRALQARGLSITTIAAAVRAANLDVGGGVLEMNEHEYVVRGRGYVQRVADLEEVVVMADPGGVPVRVRDLARVEVAGAQRRGLVELNGQGEVVGGIVVMRSGENALNVIRRVEAKLAELKGSLPEGVELLTTYDRSQLIRESVDNLASNLLQVLAIICLTIVAFLFHFRSSLVAILTLPVAILLAFIPMKLMGVTTNIMSLAGIIIAMGDMGDSAVVLVENAHRKLADYGASRPRLTLVLEAAQELGPSIFGSLLVIAISFLPVFTLEAQEGRLFGPLAWTKTFSMLAASLLAVTFVPALMNWLVRGRIRTESENPIHRLLTRSYRPIIRFALAHRYTAAVLTIVLLVATAWPFSRLGSEFMPPLDEGDVFFMPVTVPGISLEQARRLVQTQDAALRRVPEVQTVFGKAGRADTATDAAPISMIETVIRLKPRSEWRKGLTQQALLSELRAAAELPGIQAAWSMPIRARIDMLTTGIRTPIGIKVFGTDLQHIASLGQELEGILREVPGTRSVYAERELGGLYLDVVPDRRAIARYGLSMADVLSVVETAIGGMVVDRTVEGRERYTISVRYPSELRDNPDALARVLVPVAPRGSMGQASAASQQGMDTMQGAGSATTAAGVIHVPLGQLAQIRIVNGPPMIKDEDGSLVGWVYVDVEGRDLGGYVHDAKAAVNRALRLPPGYRLLWTGQWEFMERVAKRLQVVIPLTLAIIFIILYLNLRSLPGTLLVMCSVPFAAVGSIWLMWLAGFNTSIAVWVGMIALLGVAAETASVMVVYLEEGYTSARAEGRLASRQELLTAAENAATLRVRPLLMTVVMNILGLLPVMLDSGVGSDVAKRIAAPMWGGLVSLTLLTLFIIPVLYVIWRERPLRAGASSSRE
ncbi:MAG TPA: CusA/CzcA family heavy metal efflux RND transporter [Polyangiales bacterium]|nr:CusA/CzcA family heavy metal efflux RND transporter [Polyangiales bacterium]